MFSENNFNLSQCTRCAPVSSRNPRFRLMRPFWSRCRVASFALEITDSRRETRSIFVAGTGSRSLSLLDPAIRHPAARRDPRWASVAFDERFRTRVRVTFRCADWGLQRRDRDGRRENSIDRRDLRRYRVEFINRPIPHSLAEFTDEHVAFQSGTEGKGRDANASAPSGGRNKADA